MNHLDIGRQNDANEKYKIKKNIFYTKSHNGELTAYLHIQSKKYNIHKFSQFIFFEMVTMVNNAMINILIGKKSNY